MKNIAIFLLVSFAYTLSSAQSTPEQYVEAFFKEVSKANYSKAMDLLPISDKFENDTSFVSKILARLEKSTDELGKYCGYELISAEEVSPSFITYSYLIKYQEAPQRIQFVFYKPVEDWQLNRINIAAAGGQKQANKQKFRP